METAPTPRVFTVRNFAERHKGARLTEPSLRFLIFNGEQNGLVRSGAVLRIGRKLLIDEDRFFAWLLSQQKDGKHAA